MTHKSTEYNDELEAAIEAAGAAAKLIRYRAGRVAAEAIGDKGRHDLVTEVDKEAQRIIIEVLDGHFPGYDVMAEEAGADEGVRVPDGKRWIIDPIDGTTNFTHGVSPYSVSIGLQDREELVAGVVLDVASGELFTAIRGGGVFVNGVPAQVSSTPVLAEALLTTGFPYREFAHIDEYLSAFRELMKAARGIRRPGSASIDLAWVACGRFDGFFETGLYAWDVAAGIVLIGEAGGRVTGYDGSSDPLFKKHVLATNGRIHEEMQGILTTAFNESLIANN